VHLPGVARPCVAPVAERRGSQPARTRRTDGPSLPLPATRGAGIVQPATSAYAGRVPLVPILLLLLLVPLVIALMPLILVQRYRFGVARQRARGWIVTINVVGLSLSALLFLGTAAITNIWVPQAFAYAVAGFATGLALGLLGLALTRWEPTAEALHFTPYRWLVLAIMLVVSTRILYGFWRAWRAWGVAPDDTTWLAAAGVAGSLAAGAVVLGYYLVYWVGVRRRLQQQRVATVFIEPPKRVRQRR
jgi:hypothetical protein